MIDIELKTEVYLLKSLTESFCCSSFNTIQGIFQCRHFALMILTWLYQTYCLRTFRLLALLYRFVRDALSNASHVTRIRYPTQQISLNFRFSFFLFVVFSSSAKYVHILFVLFYALNWVFIYLIFFHLLCVSLTQIRYDCVGVSNTCRCFIQFLFVTGLELKMNSLFLCICSE